MIAVPALALLALIAAFLFKGWAKVDLMVTWDLITLLFLGVRFCIARKSSDTDTRRRAWIGHRRLALGRVILLALASAGYLGVGVLFLIYTRDFAPSGQAGQQSLFWASVCAVLVAWAVMHTTFAMHYAHLYYRKDEDSGACPGRGLQFPDPQQDKQFYPGPRRDPNELDFVYFAFMIGVAFQGADVSISKKFMRECVLVHSVTSFVFNTTILALAINLVFGQLLKS